MPKSMKVELDELTAKLDADEESNYLEFLRVEDMNAGLYSLRAGERDPQTPHEEDEIYHVVEGRADFRVEDTIASVGPGSVLYVRAGVDHRFENIVEDLTILVVFASGRQR